MGYAIAAGLLGAAGSIGGGLLSSGGSQSVKTQQPPSRDPFSDPLTAAASVDTLLNLGIYDPSILATAGPLQRAIQGLQRQTVGIADNDFLNYAVPLLMNEYQQLAGSGELGNLDALLNPSTTLEKDSLKRVYSDPSLYNIPRKLAMLIGQKNPDILKTTSHFIDRLSQVAEKLQATSGMSFPELFAAQKRFQDENAARDQSLSALAKETLKGRIAAANARSEMLQNLSGGIDSLRAQELARINDQLDTRKGFLERGANLAGYNPGRALGELEKSRLIDAPSEALNRAIALITGKGNLVNTLSGQTIDQSTNLGQARAGGSVASPGAVQTAPTSNLGSAVAQAVPAGLLSYNIARQFQSRGPGTSSIPNYSAGLQNRLDSWNYTGF
jgi:hypothetical protein